MSDGLVSLPLFPLRTVLFPGGLLPLRIFEARYLDMIRQAMREASEFGVCLIERGDEVGSTDVDTAPVGCKARIGQWNMEQLGVLQIDAVGTQRFRVRATAAQPDGLLVGEVEAIPDDDLVEPDAPNRPCVVLLERVVEQWHTASASGATEGTRAPFAEPYLFDDASWVGNRLAELLPLPMQMKHHLMAMTDPIARLDVLRGFLAEKGIA